MKPFNIKLSAEHRAKLEAYRAKRGLRSEADAVRDLIDQCSAGEEQFRELLRVGAAVEALPKVKPNPSSEKAYFAGAHWTDEQLGRIKSQNPSNIPIGQIRKAMPKSPKRGG